MGMMSNGHREAYNGTLQFSGVWICLGDKRMQLGVLFYSFAISLFGDLLDMDACSASSVLLPATGPCKS